MVFFGPVPDGWSWKGVDGGLAPGGDPRHTGAVRAKRVWLAGAVLLLVAGAVYSVWAWRTVEIRGQVESEPMEIRGRVVLRDWNGAVTVPKSARALVLARSEAQRMLSDHLEAWPEAWAAAEARHQEARRFWRERVAAREEALRILRVAQQANAADLAACRARYDEAEEAATAAFADLERQAEAVEDLSDPAAVLADWHGAIDGGEVGENGGFVLRARVGQRPVVVVLAGAGETGPGQAWLEALPAVGGVVEVHFSNTNVLTWERLREFAGWKESPGEQTPRVGGGE